MEKIKFGHGSLFTIPLWKDLGFLYGKMLLGSELKNKKCRQKDIFIRVYDFFTTEIKQDFDKGFFEEMDLFTDPFIISGWPKEQGENKWCLLGKDKIYEADEFVHHYIQADYFDFQVTPDDAKFWILKFGNLSNPENEFFPYYRVKHLSVHRRKSFDMISLALTFDWLRRNNKNPEDYFKFNEGLDVKKTVLYEVMKMTPDYRLIPRELRGQIAPE